MGQTIEKEARKSQLIIGLDNDAFVIGRQDRYYSSGHYLDFFQFLGNGQSLSIGFGNQIFTPDLRRELAPSEIDRPFAGINYLEFGYQKRKIKWFYEGRLLTGLIGPRSGVGQFHNWYHDSFNFPRAMGWGNQIEDSFLANLQLKAIHSLVNLGPLEVLLEGNVAMGNLEQSMSLKPIVRVGTFQPLSTSQINGSRVGTIERQEQYFHFGMDLKRVFFNRRLDGELILSEESPSFSSKNTVAEVFGEFILNYNHLGIGYGLYYRTQENEQAKNQVFGKITLSWLF